MFARSAAHLSVSPGICTHAHMRVYVREHSEELVWHPALERWKTRKRRKEEQSRRAEVAGQRGGAKRIMRVSTQRARMKARVFSGEG